MKILHRIGSLLFGAYTIFVGVPAIATNDLRLGVTALISASLAYYLWL